MPRVRVHQHVNPLAPYFRFVSKPLDLAKIFVNPDLPLHLDVGAARGRFLLKMAEIKPDWNFLGLEIREPLVAEANRIAAEKNLQNLHYEFTNATISLGNLLKNFPENVLRAVTIQFPDPWHKKKHAKRRMVTGEMVETIAAHLAVGGKVFIQTDVDFLAEEMFEIFRAFSEELREIETSENPFPVKTERESAVEEKNLPVYRTIFERI
ncbi:MAG: tRNA (guanosine(46)-N7)-methyltransferase TrmB [Acidobacteriota bacterium]|nr:tRNA (guanosine(46)-N7)-methyltransferase TrmB [Acidobacteriota bacterium]